MSIRVTSNGYDYNGDDGQNIEEQRRRNQLQRRQRQGESRGIEDLLEKRAEDVPVHVRGAEEIPDSLFDMLAQRDRAPASGATQVGDKEAADMESPRSEAKPARGPRQEQPLKRAPLRTGASPTRLPALAASAPRRQTGADAASPAPGADEAGEELRNAAQLADHLDQALDEIQARAATGESAIDQLGELIAALQRSLGRMRNIEADETSATRLDGACGFLSAYIDSLDCDDAKRAALIGSLRDSRRLLQAERQPALQRPESAGVAELSVDGADQTGTADAVKDRQTLYDYLELLKLQANGPGNGSEARPRAARFAEIQSSDPAAALLRLAASGDQSLTLYTQQISRHLQKIDAHNSSSGSARLKGTIGDWLAAKHENMKLAIRNAEDVGTYAVRRRQREEQRALETRAETMPLIILQKA
jgi:hypothetical protein